MVTGGGDVTHAAERGWRMEACTVRRGPKPGLSLLSSITKLPDILRRRNLSKPNKDSLSKAAYAVLYFPVHGLPHGGGD